MEGVDGLGAFMSLDVRIGVNPILWSNDDFHDLGGDIPFERCLAEMHQAGFAGTELGHKYPRQAEALDDCLRRHELQLVSGWHSTTILERPLADEQLALDRHLDLLAALGSRIAIVAECSRRTYTDPGVPLHFDRNGAGLSGEEWNRLASGLEQLAQHARSRGMRLAYHHHMGTVVQTEPEIGALMARTRALDLLIDTGHLAFAGADPLRVLRAHVSRVVHVHLKNIRAAVVQRARAERWSFSKAVRAGAFTVPGDGGLEFEPVLAVLRSAGYSGWLVVEAEQDPRLAPPLEYARRGREHLRQLTGI
jgi:inosose dehydratase